VRKCYGILTALGGWARKGLLRFHAMSEEQLTALLAKLNEDTELREKLKGAADLDAFLAIAKDAGFAVSKADWLSHQRQQNTEIEDSDLEQIAGGTGSNWEGCTNCICRDTDADTSYAQCD
jgi:predicted ribosomally synthesized peptide with nif11-like leader